MTEKVKKLENRSQQNNMKINQVTEGSVRRDMTDFLSGLLSEQLKIPREQLNSAVYGSHTIPHSVMVQSLRYHTEILKSHQGKGEDRLTSWEKGYILIRAYLLTYRKTEAYTCQKNVITGEADMLNHILFDQPS